MTLDLDPIRARLAAATSGPWRWYGETRGKSVYLATVGRGRQFVMTFGRWGMGAAAPLFQRDGFMRRVDEDGMPVYDVAPDAMSPDDPKVYRHDFSAIRHPDAELIAHAPTDLAALLAEVEHLRARLAEYEPDDQPGGPLCACETCDAIRERENVEELSPAMIAESERRQAASDATPAGVTNVAVAGGVL